MTSGFRLPSALQKFLQEESAGGLLLMAAAAAALVISNSPLAENYFHLLETPLAGASLLHWINDGLMAIFFLLVGLEVKREILDGELASWQKRILPGVAAAGGMIAPALIYLALNANNGETLRGWAIPAATDIAFALGVLALLGSRAPVSLKIFLAALAILDDLGAIVIIALFYASAISLPALAGAGALTAALFALNRLRVTMLWPYLALGVGLWVCVLHSGVHATLAGVILALAIPLKQTASAQVEHRHASPLYRLEHALGPWVAFGVVPIFGFANAGVSLAGLGMGDVLAPVSLGIALGLFLGKQIGVLAFSWAVIKLKLADLPAHATWAQFYGVSILCGIGFTMSLFIGGLAFTDPTYHAEVKLGVLAGSLLSGLAGFLLLRLQPRS